MRRDKLQLLKTLQSAKIPKKSRDYEQKWTSSLRVFSIKKFYSSLISGLIYYDSKFYPARSCVNRNKQMYLSRSSINKQKKSCCHLNCPLLLAWVAHSKLSAHHILVTESYICSWRLDAALHCLVRQWKT